MKVEVVTEAKRCDRCLGEGQKRNRNGYTEICSKCLGDGWLPKKTLSDYQLNQRAAFERIEMVQESVK